MLWKDDPDKNAECAGCGGHLYINWWTIDSQPYCGDCALEKMMEPQQKPGQIDRR